MLFQLPYRVCLQDQTPYLTTDPDDPGLHRPGVVVSRPSCKYPRLGVTVNGSYRTVERDEVIGLMQAGGALIFRALDAVDEGILTKAEVKGLGFVVPLDAGGILEPGHVQDPPQCDPLDMDTASKPRIIEWALDQVPPINLDSRKRKDNLVLDLTAELATRKLQMPKGVLDASS